MRIIQPNPQNPSIFWKTTSVIFIVRFYRKINLNERPRGNTQNASLNARLPVASLASSPCARHASPSPRPPGSSSRSVGSTGKGGDRRPRDPDL